MDTKDSDRKLLKWAAKAAGYLWDDFYDGPNIGVVNERTWNPLDDDGDEARLEATLELYVIWEASRKVVLVGRGMTEVEEPYGADRQAARRRAGVRAAAEIGRNMP